MREKDEQLKGFQIELEQLISGMRSHESEKTSRSNGFNNSGGSSKGDTGLPYQ